MLIDSGELQSWLDNGAHIVYANTTKPAKQINSFAEVFLEYYLFDSSCSETIEKFLFDEKLSDVFTESQFVDLMCGNAFVNDTLIPLIHAKLPFEISLARLHKLNAKMACSNAYEIRPGKIDLTNKEQYSKQEKARRKKAEYNKRYREKHAAKIKQAAQESYQKNRDKRLAYARERYYKNPLEYNARSREYYKKNQAACAARDKRYYAENHEHALARSQKYRDNHPNLNKDAYQKIKARKELAKTMCPVFIFLCELRATKFQTYLTKYKRVQDIPGQAIRAGCDALALADNALCPILFGGVSQRTKCPMQLAFEFRGAVGRVTQIAQEIKANQKH